MVSGGVAGLLNSVIVCPTELVKCKMQMQKKKKIYKNSWDCAKVIWREEGFRGEAFIVYRENREC